MKHTALPWNWKQTRGNNVFEHRVFTHDQTIAELNGENAENVKANAEFIVRACNCHEELVKLCKELADFLYGVSESVDLVPNKTYPLFKAKYSKAYSILAELEK